MMRIAALSILFFFTGLTVYAQHVMSPKLETGLNRIGVFYEAGANHKWGKHEWDWGIRYYEPDLVFERNLPGVTLGYYYRLLDQNKWHLTGGLSCSFFHENKGTTALWLLDPKLRFGPGWNISSKWELNFFAGFGSVINFVTADYLYEKENFNYLNYALSFRVIYRFVDAPL